MDKLFNTDLTIEKMAAYLDGNLSDTEMQNVFDIIGCNGNLKQFMESSSQIDDSLSAYSPSDLELPEELQSLDFSIPSLDDSMHHFVVLSTEPAMYDILGAACAMAPAGDICDIADDGPNNGGDLTLNIDDTPSLFIGEGISLGTEDSISSKDEDY